MGNIFKKWEYVPILAISPAEMLAMKELPDKDKDKILTVFGLKPWGASNKLDNTIERIKQTVDDRNWIADIDTVALRENKTYLFTGKHPDRQVFKSLLELLSPTDGYRNWCDFIADNENAIPCIRHESLEGIQEQINRMVALGRGIVVRIKESETNRGKNALLLSSLRESGSEDILLIYDLERIDINYKERMEEIRYLVSEAQAKIKNLCICVSSTSFPNSFSKQQKGQFTIYERLLFNKIQQEKIAEFLIYSDRGSTRCEKGSGGSSTPPPRIDYPLKNDWHFVRREFNENVPSSRSMKIQLYKEIAQEIVEAEYWRGDIRLWGTQQIELTAEGSDFGISNPGKSTAVRINLHLFTQLYYDSVDDSIDTDEDWVD